MRRRYGKRLKGGLGEAGGGIEPPPYDGDTSMTMVEIMTSFMFRSACEDHNHTHGRFLSWAEARAMWKRARLDAVAYVARLP